MYKTSAHCRWLTSEKWEGACKAAHKWASHLYWKDELFLLESNELLELGAYTAAAIHWIGVFLESFQYGTLKNKTANRNVTKKQGVYYYIRTFQDGWRKVIMGME